MGRGLSRTKLWAKGGSASSGGGGGGGDMTKAVYDPANLTAQVIVEPISITYYDFIDLKDGTNLNGNNPSLNRLLLGQTYAVTSLIVWGYDSNCKLYVTTVADDAGTVKPAAIGTLTYPTTVDVNKVMTVMVDWFDLVVKQVFFQENVLQEQAGAVSIEAGLISGSITSNVSSCRFYRTEYDVSGTANGGSNVSLVRTTFDNSYIYVLADQIVSISRSDIKNSSLTFTPADGSGNFELLSTIIENSVVTYSDNTGASSNTTLEDCYISNITITLGKNVSLTGCRFIGPGDWYTISIPDGYTAVGKTFIYNDWSDFETTVDLNTAVTGGTTLTLPTPYRDWVGIYRTTNATVTAYALDVIDVGSNAAHKFMLFGNADRKTNFIPTVIGGSPNPGNFFSNYVMNVAGIYELVDDYDYLEFKKDNIEGVADTLRITDYGILS